MTGKLKSLCTTFNVWNHFHGSVDITQWIICKKTVGEKVEVFEYGLGDVRLAFPNVERHT